MDQRIADDIRVRLQDENEDRQQLAVELAEGLDRLAFDIADARGDQDERLHLERGVATAKAMAAGLHTAEQRAVVAAIQSHGQAPLRVLTTAIMADIERP